MDCFLDFCLACDKQTTDGLYCSQACRLADLEKAGNSAPVSPSAPGSIDQASWHLSRPTPNTVFSLPTGFDFGKSKSASETSNTRRERVLSPSSSRSSLASSTSNTSTHATQMSEQAQQELQDYVSSFDSIREMKRRSLSSNTSQ